MAELSRSNFYVPSKIMVRRTSPSTLRVNAIRINVKEFSARSPLNEHLNDCHFIEGIRSISHRFLY